MPIKTTNPYSHVFVNPFDAQEIWLAIHLENGSANVILTKEQAQELIDQLTALIIPSDDEPAEQDPEPPYRARNTYSLEELKGIL